MKKEFLWDIASLVSLFASPFTMLIFWNKFSTIGNII